MTGFFAYKDYSPRLTPSDSTEFSPPYQAIRNDGNAAVTAVIRTVNNDAAGSPVDRTIQNIQPGETIAIKFKQLRTGSGTTLCGLLFY